MTESSPSSSVAPVPARELRDSERIIGLWRKKAFKFGEPPPATAFDFSWLIHGNWGYRFLISADAVCGDHVFLMYGPQFARVLELSDHADFNAPIMRQLPERYRSLFNEGCSEAMAKTSPVRVSGAIEQDDGEIELYRAAFVPLAGPVPSSAQLVFGTFNRRIGHEGRSGQPSSGLRAIPHP
jgi:hypothetical protein